MTDTKNADLFAELGNIIDRSRQFDTPRAIDVLLHAIVCELRAELDDVKHWVARIEEAAEGSEAARPASRPEMADAMPSDESLKAQEGTGTKPLSPELRERLGRVTLQAHYAGTCTVSWEGQAESVKETYCRTGEAVWHERDAEVAELARLRDCAFSERDLWQRKAEAACKRADELTSSVRILNQTLTDMLANPTTGWGAVWQHLQPDCNLAECKDGEPAWAIAKSVIDRIREQRDALRGNLNHEAADKRCMQRRLDAATVERDRLKLVADDLREQVANNEAERDEAIKRAEAADEELKVAHNERVELRRRLHELESYRCEACAYGAKPVFGYPCNVCNHLSHWKAK